MLQENNALEMLKEMQTDLFAVIICRSEDKEGLEIAYQKSIGGLIHFHVDDLLEKGRLIYVKEKFLKRQILEADGVV